MGIYWQRAGVLRKLLKCLRQLPTAQIIQFKMSITLRLRNHSLEHTTEELMMKKTLRCSRVRFNPFRGHRAISFLPGMM